MLARLVRKRLILNILFYSRLTSTFCPILDYPQHSVLFSLIFTIPIAYSWNKPRLENWLFGSDNFTLLKMNPTDKRGVLYLICNQCNQVMQTTAYQNMPPTMKLRIWNTLIILFQTNLREMRNQPVYRGSASSINQQKLISLMKIRLYGKQIILHLHQPSSNCQSK